MCDFFFTDAITWRCHAMPVLCYTAGTLTLPKIPESGAELATMPYRLDVTRDALRLQAAF